MPVATANLGRLINTLSTLLDSVSDPQTNYYVSDAIALASDVMKTSLSNLPPPDLKSKYQDLEKKLGLLTEILGSRTDLGQTMNELRLQTEDFKTAAGSLS